MVQNDQVPVSDKNKLKFKITLPVKINFKKFNLVHLSFLLSSILCLIYLFNVLSLYSQIKFSTSISLTEVYSIFDYHPLFIYFPFVYILLFASLLFITIKIFQRSSYIRLVNLFFCLLLPFATLLISRTLSYSIVTPQGNQSDLISQILSPSFFSFAIFVYLICIAQVILSFFEKKYFVSSEKLKLSQYSMLVIPVVILSGLSAYAVYENQNRLKSTDYYLSQTQNSVSYHVYKADPTSVGLVYTTTYYKPNIFLADKTNGTQVAYDLSLKDIRVKNQIKATVMKEVGVDDGFELKSFVDTSYVTSDSTVSPISLTTAKDLQGISVTRHYDNTTYSVIAFVTPDNVLVVISSEWLSVQELITLANTIK